MSDETLDTGAPEALIHQTRLIQFPGGRTDLDSAAIDTAADAHARGERFLMRLQPDLATQGANYRPWPGVSWRAEFADAEALIRFREELNLFLQDWFARQTAAAAQANG